MASYPPVEPYISGRLDAGEGHSLYWEEVGNPNGIPSVFLHGGPGSGCQPGARQYFNPSTYRAIFLDQRGCGRSRPLASEADADLTTNTTSHLIGDLERLRVRLGVDRWVVAGVSWGVTLALAYAQQHPERVRAMVLGAVTTGTQLEIEWITRDIGRVFPREWDRFVSGVPEAERGDDLAAAYARLLASPSPAVHAKAARAWCDWENTHVSLMPGWRPDPRYDDPQFRLTFARLVTHYWRHGCFLAEGQITANVHLLAEIPAVLVHGRHDVSSPLETAWRLHQAWPASELVVLDDAGHGGGSFAVELGNALDRVSERAPRSSRP